MASVLHSQARCSLSTSSVFHNTLFFTRSLVALRRTGNHVPLHYQKSPPSSPWKRNAMSKLPITALMWLLPPSRSNISKLSSLMASVNVLPQALCPKNSLHTASISQCFFPTSVRSGGGGPGHGGRGGPGKGRGGDDGMGHASSETNGSVGGDESKGNGDVGVFILDVGGMSCGGCAASVKNILEAQPFVTRASVNLATESAQVLITIHQDSKELQLDGVAKSLADHLTDCGFTSSVRAIHGPSEGSSSRPAFEKKQQERIKRLEEIGRRLAVAWTLAAVCLLGHASHLFAHAGPHWLHFLHSTPVHAGICVATLAGPGRKLLVDGFQSLLRNSPNMNTLVGLGAVSSFLVSCVAAMVPKLGWPMFFEEPVMLLAFVLLGRAVEERAKLQASSDMIALLSLVPSQARMALLPDRNLEDLEGLPETVKVATESLSPGDTVVVLPGDVVPVDGVVTWGRTTVDESSLTGEPLPVLKAKGDEVTAGSMNFNGAITVEANRAGGETVLTDIVRMVEAAQSRQAPVQRLADQVAGKFCYGVMGLAAASFAFWSSVGAQLFPAVVPAGGPLLLGLHLACNVLVIACPCALGLATPTAVLVGTSVGARKGLLIRGGDVLEQVAAVDTIVFDKTGTLTAGRPVVASVVPDREWMGQECLQDTEAATERLLSLAAGVESSSSHPLARALVMAASSANCQTLQASEGSFEQEPGAGASAMINGRRVSVGKLEWLQQQGCNTDQRLPAHPTDKSNTVVYIAVDSQLAGTVSIRDQVREDARRCITELQEQGYSTMMLSGDRREAAMEVARQVGIAEDKVFAGMSPQGKAAFVSSLRREGACVAMVGDGINDAAALAEAHVGIAMAGGVRAAAEVASVVLTGDRLSQVLEAVHLSKATMSKIRQNLFWAFLYNVVGLPVAAGALLPVTGTMLTPSLAGAFMGVSSLGVMANSLTLQLQNRRWSSQKGASSSSSASAIVQLDSALDSTVDEQAVAGAGKFAETGDIESGRKEPVSVTDRKSNQI